MSEVHSEYDAALCIEGRLSKPPEDVMVASAFASELQAQLWLSEAFNWVDIAHVIALVEAGVIEKTIGANLLVALRKLQENSADFKPDPKCGDLFTNREIWLDQNSNTAGWLCAGRARREATTVAYHLTIKINLLDLADEILALLKVMLMQSASHRLSIMPDYTYMQAGQTTSFGHYLLSFVFMLLRDLARIESLFGRVNKCPAGCGGINGSTLEIDREKLATMLGFAKPIMHTRDAMWQADIPIEVISTLTSIFITLDRLSEDLLHFVTKEFNYVELQDSCSRASKIMPQKKNPYGLTYIRALTNKFIGIQNMVVAMQRTPTGQIDNRLFVYGETPAALRNGAEGINLLKTMLEGLHFNSACALIRVKESFSMATELAELISAENNIDYRTAHKIVGKIVQKYSLSNKCLFELTEYDLNEVTKEVIDRTILCSERIFKLLESPEASIEKKNGLGGTSEARVLEMIEHSKEEISKYQRWIEISREKRRQMETTLLQHSESIINQVK